MKPKHYESKNGNDVINFCNDNNINFNRGNIIKYIVRAGRKENELQDLQKAMEYLTREIQYYESNTNINELTN